MVSRSQPLPFTYSSSCSSPKRFFSFSLTEVLPPPCSTSDLSRPRRREVYTRGPSAPDAGPSNCAASASLQRLFIERIILSAMWRIELLSWERARARAMPIREAVFVAEQGVPAELEMDEFDADCLHA